MREKLQLTGFCFLSLYILVVMLFMPSTAGNMSCMGTIVSVGDSVDYKFVNETDVLEYIDSKNINPSGLSYKNIHLHDMERMIASMPFVKDAQCYKSPRGYLCIDIIQRKPLLRIMTPTQNLYLDSEGQLMDTSQDFTAYVPVLSSEKTLDVDFLSTEMYEFAYYVFNDKFLSTLVEQVYIDSKDKVEIVPRIGSHIVVLGTLDGYKKKMTRLKKLYENGFSKVGWNKYKKIDLTYDNQAVCTKE